MAAVRSFMSAMADEKITEFLETLRHLRGAGAFCVAGRLPHAPPDIMLPDGEDLALPLTKAQAADIRTMAERAPYGMGTETRLDESVRRCWQIDASELPWISPEWRDGMDALAMAVAQDLGVEGEVTADPYKLLLYDTGGFFLPHRDTEKQPGMFGTLIVSLPSRHTGGELLVRHGGREVRVDFAAETGPAGFPWAAFFADCEHEVLPVKTGNRLCLVFNLVRAKRAAGRAPTAPVDASGAVEAGLRQIASVRRTDLTAILLDHHYTEEGLSVATLKGEDRARADALFAAAEKTGLVARLALVCLHKLGELEGGYDHYYSSRRGRHRGWGRRWADDDDDTDSDEGSMGSIIETTLTLSHWRKPTDRRDSLGDFAISEEQILSLTRLDAGEPDEKFAEGYTGNAGCTMEHWYRRAAVVVWPREAAHDIEARYDFHAAAQRFQTAVAPRRNAKALAMGHALVDEAERRIQQAMIDYPKGEDSIAARHVGTLFPAVLRGMAALADAALFQRVLRRHFLCAFAAADPGTWAALLTAFGGRPVDFLAAESRAPLLPALLETWGAALGAALSAAEEVVPQFASMLPRLVAALQDELNARRHWQWTARTPEQRAQQAHPILAASHVVQEEAARATVRAWLRGDGGLPHLRNVLAPALLMTTHQRWFAHPNSLASELRATAIETLGSEIERPILPYRDFRRPVPSVVAPKEHIGELLAFMVDPAAESHAFRMAQHYREEIESFVNSHELDLHLTTHPDLPEDRRFLPPRREAACRRRAPARRTPRRTRVVAAGPLFGGKIGSVLATFSSRSKR